VPKRNYQFEKRQKDLARKQKQEDKLKRRLERARAAEGSEAGAEPPPESVEEPPR